MRASHWPGYRCVLTLAIAAALAAATSAHADVDPNSGIDFIRVGNAGNPGINMPGLPIGFQGRGATPYEYQIGRTEVATAQWVEFYNSVRSRYGDVFETPFVWGAVSTGNPSEPYRVSTAPGAALRPVSGVTWRTAAYFCNWLHNNKQNDLASLTNGAYDTSTFGYNGNIFTDQAAHNPDARYWIPTLDEWIKAAYYDPTKNGGAGGYWLYPNASDTPLTYGPPPSFGGDGTGQANSGFDLPGNAQFRIPLLSYSTASYYGMRDAAGGTTEWTESIYTAGGIPNRFIHGSAWAAVGYTGDRINAVGSLFPDSEGTIFGFRIASSIPSPSTSGILLVVGGLASLHRRRRTSSCVILRSQL